MLTDSSRRFRSSDEHVSCSRTAVYLAVSLIFRQSEKSIRHSSVNRTLGVTSSLLTISPLGGWNDNWTPTTLSSQTWRVTWCLSVFAAFLITSTCEFPAHSLQIRLRETPYSSLTVPAANMAPTSKCNKRPVHGYLEQSSSRPQCASTTSYPRCAQLSESKLWDAYQPLNAMQQVFGASACCVANRGRTVDVSTLVCKLPRQRRSSRYK